MCTHVRAIQNICSKSKSAAFLYLLTHSIQFNFLFVLFCFCRNICRNCFKQQRIHRILANSGEVTIDEKNVNESVMVSFLKCLKSRPQYSFFSLSLFKKYEEARSEQSKIVKAELDEMLADREYAFMDEVVGDLSRKMEVTGQIFTIYSHFFFN